MNQSLITVFGGSGFLGREIVRRLLQADTPVRIAARHPERVNFPEQTREPERLSVDVRDEAAVRRAVAGAGGVVNAVSLYVEKKGLSFEAIHVEAARRIARCAREAGVRTLIQISGIGVDTHSASPYVRARARGEQVVTGAFDNTVVLRPSVLFGPGDSFLNTLASLSRLPVIPLFGRGQTRLQPVYVGDVAEAVKRALERPETGIFELGGAGIYTYRDLLELVLAHQGKRRPLVSVPFPLWHGLAKAASLLPGPPLTVDQVVLMERDNVTGTLAGLGELGIKPVDIASELSHVLGSGKRR